MDIAFSIALGIHLLSILGMLILLLRQIGKNPQILPGGFTHAAATAVVAGIFMMATFSMAHPDEEANQGKFGAKFLVGLVILGIAYANNKKPVLKKSAWWGLLALIALNIVIASVL